jgi:protoporphyrinogen oxidase
MPQTVKVAVVGSGLAGLTAAHLLNGSKSGVKFEVHLFEKVNAGHFSLFIY